MITAVIPARFNSTRFPGKPLADIAGKPLVQWTYEGTVKCPLLDRTVVATDDERIARAVESFGGSVCITSDTHPSGTDRVAEAARILRLPDDSIVVNVQGDQPLIEPASIEKILGPLQENPGFHMSTLSCPVSNKQEIEDPNIVKVVSAPDGSALYFSRSPVPWSPGGAGAFSKHIGLYAFKAGFLKKFTKLPPSALEKRERLEQLRALENGFRVAVVEAGSDPVEVDSPEDIIKVTDELSRRARNARHPKVPLRP